VLALLVCFASVTKNTLVLLKTTLGLRFSLFFFTNLFLVSVFVSFGVGT